MRSTIAKKRNHNSPNLLQLQLILGGVKVARKAIDINKLLEETKYLECVDINFELKRVDIDALLDHGEICELCNHCEE